MRLLACFCTRLATHPTAEDRIVNRVNIRTLFMTVIMKPGRSGQSQL